MDDVDWGSQEQISRKTSLLVDLEVQASDGGSLTILLTAVREMDGWMDFILILEIESML